MQNKIIGTYFFILITLIVMMSLSRYTTEEIRGSSVGFLAPMWEKVLTIKHFFLHPTQPNPFTALSSNDTIHQIQVENQLLESELSFIKQLLNEQMALSSQISSLALAAPDEAYSLAKEQKKSINRSIARLEWRLKALPAQVIFRSLDSWNRTLWINVGESSNQESERPIVSKNSPVIVGKAIVGAIDYVGKHSSRVRLITDNSLTLSVRAARSGEQELLIHEYAGGLLQQINRKNLPVLTKEEQTQLVNLLQKLKQQLKPFKKSSYLAKGELTGTSLASRGNHVLLLKGSGFNYDFSDEEGEGRDLRTGKPLNHSQEQAIPILKVHDILITTGLDGIFPANFQVATISKIELLKEGDYFYDLEVKPIAGPLEELFQVFVLPPLIDEQIDQHR